MLLVVTSAALALAPRAAASTFTVDRFTDAADATPGDGLCQTAPPGGCSLRAAVQEANADPGADVIDLPAGSTSVLDPGLGVLNVTDALTVQGGSGVRAIVDGGGAAGVFQVYQNAIPLTLDHVQVQGASGQAGVFSYVSAGGETLNVDDSVIRANTNISSDGGGIYSNGALNITDSTVTGNSASSGGGIYIAGGTIDVNRSLIQGNQASAGTGGIDMSFDQGSVPSLTVENSTFSGNSGADGSALIADNGTVNVYYSTFADNTGTPTFVIGQGVYNTTVHGTAHLVGSIIQPDGNSACAVEGTGTLDGSYDVIGDLSCTGITNGTSGNATGVSSIGLGPLDDQGGKTLTYSLDADSIAIDHGPANCSPPLSAAEDQRGFPRPYGPGCDAGSYEYTPPPDTSIDSGPTGPTNDPTPTFTFSGSPAGISAFECRLYPAGDTPPAFSACTSPYASSHLDDGDYVFEVSAVDSNGQADPTPATASFTVDTQAPDTAIDSGPSGPTNNSTPTFVFSSPDPSALFKCSLDGGPYSACASPYTTPRLADGVHTFSAEAYDAAGNVDPTPATGTFTVDTQAPDTAIDSGPSGQTNYSILTFTFSSPDPSASFKCSLDGAAFSACASPYTTPQLADGVHAFAVEAYDAAGNVDPTPATRTFTVATQASNAVPAPHVGLAGKPGFTGAAVLGKLACAASGSTCRGKVTLLYTETVVTRRHGKARRHQVTLVVGTVSYSISSGRSTKITVTLRSNGKKLLRALHKLRIKGTVTVVQLNGRSTTALTFTLTLKPEPKRHRH